MDSRCSLFLIIAGITSFVSGRAVNISNTWMLPEEGFPVFYRYFRDRISWYEADAVCQFHHANLVTAESSSQYDAIRAYLKELDITDNVWIGLSRQAEKNIFSWTDFQPLSEEGYWQQPIPKKNDSLCVVMDPSSDFLWSPLTCGGPDVASFICELPVPSWAIGPQGCLLTELPSLTILYIPEQLALELTSDCGLEGTKNLTCTGNANREDILRHLTCALPLDDLEDKLTKPPLAAGAEFENSVKTTKPWIWTSNTIDIDYGMPTRHRRETEDTLSPVSTKSTIDFSGQDSRNNKFTTAISHPRAAEDVTRINLQEDVTFKELDLKTTHTVEFTTPEVSSSSQERAEFPITTEESLLVSSSELEDNGQYASVIEQGQLLDVIENGTIFDIVEVNDTGTDVDLADTPQPEIETTPSSLTEKYTKEITTTQVTQTETTNTTFKDKHLKKNTELKKPKFPLKENLNPDNSSSTLQQMNKEVDLYSIPTDPQLKLNRTFRKQLPPEINIIRNTAKKQLIQIKMEEKEENAAPGTENKQLVNDKLEVFDEERTNIDSKLHLLNANNLTENNQSERVSFSEPEKIKSSIDEEDRSIAEVEISSTDSTEQEPEANRRPNRQRQLTRPQRRSFYPYFFSRVLG